MNVLQSGSDSDWRSSGIPSAIIAGRQRHARWYVVETLPQKEVCAAENMKRQGFEVFFPRFRKVRNHARKRETILAPVFPGYMFTRLDLKADRWVAINSTRGVKRLVGFDGGRPQEVDPEVMEALLDRCEHGVMSQMVERLNPGDSVRVNTGPLADLVGTIESLDSKGRVNLLFQILGSPRVITVPRSAVRPAGS